MTSTEQEILGLEKAYWQAIKDKDFEKALEMSDDPCIVTGPQGFTSITRDQFKEMMNSSDFVLKDFKIQDGAKILMLTPDVAVLAYDAHEDLIVDDKPLSLDAAEASTWIRRDGRWLCSMRSESLHGDPFGRDRTQSSEAA